MNKLSIVIILTACIGLIQSCKDDDSTCTKIVYDFKPSLETYRQSFDNIDSMIYKRERYGKVDTVFYVRDTIIDDFIVSPDCPDYNRDFQRKSIRYKSFSDEELVIEMLQISTGCIMNTFIRNKILFTSANYLDSSIFLKTGNFTNCNISTDGLNAYNYVPGYSEKVIIKGDIDIDEFGQPTSRSYFNLKHGLVFISLYENTDSLLTYQRIL